MNRAAPSRKKPDIPAVEPACLREPDRRPAAARVLVADDDPMMRLVLRRTLEKWGYEVETAADGSEAWRRLERDSFGLVVTDWVMPGMTGPELCRKIRSAGFRHYVFVVLLTARDEKGALVEGMEAGADDFVVKPFQEAELKVRLRAGERILELQRDLAERNARLEAAYAAAEQDLKAAAEMQKALLPPPDLAFPGLRTAWTFLPSRYVAGDTLNCFRLDEHHVGFYLLDVAGHGVAAAMLSFTLTKVLCPQAGREGLLKRATDRPPFYALREPSEVLAALNERFEDPEGMRYFTMVYGIVDLRDGRVRLGQAGHPAPLHQRGRQVHVLQASGFPVGVLRGASYEQRALRLGPGERLFVYSDGVTECRNPAGHQFRVERLVRYASQTAEKSLADVVGGVARELRAWKGDDEFADDITMLALERPAPERGR